MSRSIVRKAKRRSKAQVESQKKSTLASQARWYNKHAGRNNDTISTSENTINDLKDQVSNYKQQLMDQKRKYQNEQRKNHQLQKASTARKLDLKRVKEQAYRMRGALQMLGKELEEVQGAADESICLLQVRIRELEAAKKDLMQTHHVLRKRLPYSYENTHLLYYKTTPKKIKQKGDIDN